MIDDSNTRKDQLMFNIIDELIENDQVVHWSTGKLKGSGKSPSQTSKDKALDLIRKAVNPRRDEPKLTGRQSKEMERRGKKMRALVTSGPTERPSVRSRGQSPQKERDANTVTGDLPKVAAGIRIRDGHRVGGEGDNTIVTGIHGPTDKGTGRGIRNKATRASTIGTLGVKSKSLNSSFDLISDLIEANPPKPNAHRVVDKNHQRRTDGMTAYSGVDREGNIRLKDVFVPKGKDSGKGRALSYVTGLRKYSEKIGKTLSLNAVPGNKPGEREGLDRLYTRAGLVKDPSKPGNTYISKPKNVNKGDNRPMKKSQSINSSYEYELNEKYVKANDPSGKGPDHRKPPEVKTRRPTTPDNEKYSEAEFGAAGKSPTTRKRKDTIRPAVGGKQYNEELIARFRNRIDEGMSRRFSTTTPAKAAARIGTVIKQLEAKPESATQTPEPTVRRSKISLSNIKIADDPTSGRGRRR